MKANKLIHFGYLVLALLFLFPLIWMGFAALTPEGTDVSRPVNWFTPPYTMQNLGEILRSSRVLLWTWNSMVIAVVSTVLNLAACCMAAFAIAKIPFRGSRIVEYMILAGLLIPSEALLIALFTVIKDMGFLDTRASVILPAAAAPLGVIILKRFFQALPKDLFEIAHIEGASIFHIFFIIALPLITASMAAVTIFTFLGNWNNFLWPYIAIFTEELYTLPLGIPSFNNAYAQDYILPLTVNLAASLPAVLLFIFGQNQIIQGITSTGLKG